MPDNWSHSVQFAHRPPCSHDCVWIGRWDGVALKLVEYVEGYGGPSQWPVDDPRSLNFGAACSAANPDPGLYKMTWRTNETSVTVEGFLVDEDAERETEAKGNAADLAEEIRP